MKNQSVSIPFVRHLLAFLSFVIPTLVLGFGYKFHLFNDAYAQLAMYRDDVAMGYAFGSLIIQGVFWAWLCARLFIYETFIKRAVKLFCVAFPIGFSFNVCVIAAKHTMSSVTSFALYETVFTFLMYLIVCPLIALSYTMTASNKKT